MTIWTSDQRRIYTGGMCTLYGGDAYSGDVQIDDEQSRDAYSGDVYSGDANSEDIHNGVAYRGDVNSGDAYSGDVYTVYSERRLFSWHLASLYV